jgi:hypothetical protein
MLDSREPPHGDFVAFVEKLEREQLARAMQPHKLPHLTVGGKAATGDKSGNAPHSLSAAEAQRVLESLKHKGGGVAPRGAVVGAIVGGALIAFGLIAEGGAFFVILGAVLLWHNLAKLRRSAASGSPGTAAPQVAQTFGQSTARTARKRGG